MRGFSKRIAVLALAGAGAAGLVVAGAGAASADVTGGTVTLTLNDSFLVQLAKAGVVVAPQGAASVTETSNTVAVTYTATGGLGDLQSFGGTVNLSGAVLAFSLSGHCATLSGLGFDVGNGSVDGALPNGAATPLLDLGGTETAGIVLPNETFTASQLTVDAAGAALLDGALHTKAFTAGETVGSFSAAWTVG